MGQKRRCYERLGGVAITINEITKPLLPLPGHQITDQTVDNEVTLSVWEISGYGKEEECIE